MKTRLKKLMLKRPPLQALQEKGLIKGVSRFEVPPPFFLPFRRAPEASLFSRLQSHKMLLAGNFQCWSGSNAASWSERVRERAGEHIAMAKVFASPDADY